MASTSINQFKNFLVLCFSLCLMLTNNVGAVVSGDLNCPDRPCDADSYCNVYLKDSPSGRNCMQCSKCNENPDGVNVYESRACSKFHDSLCCSKPNMEAVYDKEMEEYVCGQENDITKKCSCPPTHFCEINKETNPDQCSKCTHCDTNMFETKPCSAFNDTLCCSEKSMKGVYSEHQKKFICGELEKVITDCNAGKLCPDKEFCKIDTDTGHCETCTRCSENDVDVYEILPCEEFTDTLCCPQKDMRHRKSDNGKKVCGAGPATDEDWLDDDQFRYVYFTFVVVALLASGFYVLVKSAQDLHGMN